LSLLGHTMTPLRTVRMVYYWHHACSVYLLWWHLLGWYLKVITFKCAPSDYTKTEFGFWAKFIHASQEPTQRFALFYQPDWCSCVIYSTMPTLLLCLDCPVLSPGSAFFCLLFLDHACRFYLPPFRTVSKGVTNLPFKCASSNYTKGEHGFWSNPTMPLWTHPMTWHFFTNLTDVGSFSIYNANIIMMLVCLFLSPGAASFCLYFFDHGCVLYLLWGLLLGRYLKGMA
jgi:hypothetical protein